MINIIRMIFASATIYLHCQKRDVEKMLSKLASLRKPASRSAWQVQRKSDLESEKTGK